MNSGIRQRLIVLTVALGTALSLAAVFVDPSPVAACSCEQVGTDADTVAAADIAFVGSVVTVETLSPPKTDPSVSESEGGLHWDVRYQVSVSEPVKGVERGQLVVVFGSRAGSICGSHTLPIDAVVAIALTEVDTGGWRRFPADVVGDCGRPTSVEGFREIAARDPVGDLFESPNILAPGAGLAPPLDDDTSSWRSSTVVQVLIVLALMGAGVFAGTVVFGRRRD